MYDEKTDVMVNYQSISNKLRKKRILKKPNVTDSGLQFENLGKICQQEELEQYAGLCYHSAAKCQNSLGNNLEGGFLLKKSSKQFMSSYVKLLRNQSVLNEFYSSYCLTHYRECLSRLQENKECSKLVTQMITGGVILEMGEDLMQKVGTIREACQEHQRALKFFTNSSVEKIICLQKMTSSHIKLGSFYESLKLTDEIITEGKLLSNCNFKNEMLRNAEITRIFLLLILQPTPQQISPVAAAALEKFAWVETDSSGEVKDIQTMLGNQGLSMLDGNLFLKLQSLVMACQYCDLEVFTCVQSDLLPHLNVEQKDLLKTLIRQYL